MQLDFSAEIDRLNRDEPIPRIDPADLQGALAFFAELRAIHPRATSEGFDDAQHYPPPGFPITDLGERCGAAADRFAVVLRAALADVILGTHPDDHARTDHLVRVIAEMPLAPSDLNNPKVIYRRIQEFTQPGGDHGP